MSGWPNERALFPLFFLSPPFQQHTPDRLFLLLLLPVAARWGHRCWLLACEDFTMSLGGIDYTACPFNGWFMNTEVSADRHERTAAHDVGCNIFIHLVGTHGPN